MHARHTGVAQVVELSSCFPYVRYYILSVYNGQAQKADRSVKSIACGDGIASRKELVQQPYGWN